MQNIMLGLLILSLSITQLDAQNAPTGSQIELPTSSIAKQLHSPLDIETFGDQNNGSFVDDRNGQSYFWVRLKDRSVWMVKNLNYTSPDSWCYENQDANCVEYGRLYTWEAAKKACPAGWVLPTDEDWKRVAMAYGGYYDYNTLKNIDDSKVSFLSLLKGGDSGFSALLGGRRESSEYFGYLDQVGSYWTSSADESSHKVWQYDFRGTFGFLGRYPGNKKDGGSVRCILQSSQSPAAPIREAGTFTYHRDGQTYSWIRLEDGKKWMTQNLNFESENSWCHDDDTKNCSIYGRLYTWKAALKACPKGWRLPSDNDWWKMTSAFGMAYNDDSGQQKNTDSDGGKAAYKALLASDRGQFSALLGGIRWFDGKYIGHLGYHGYYWSNTEASRASAWQYVFSSVNGALIRQSFDKNSGQSCRCIQD